MKSEQLLYRNVQLNCNNLVPMVVSYLEDSGQDSVLLLCSRSKKTKCSGNKGGTLPLWTNETENHLYHIFNFWIWLSLNTLIRLYKPTAIILQFPEVKFYFSKEIEVQTHFDINLLLKSNWQRGKTYDCFPSQESGNTILKKCKRIFQTLNWLRPHQKKRT